PLDDHVIELLLFERSPDYHHHVDSSGEEVACFPECLSDQTLCTITDNGVSNPSGCHDSEPSRSARVVSCIEQENEVRSRCSPASTLRGFELEPLSDSGGGRETNCDARPRHLLLVCRDGEAHAPLAPAVLQDVLSALGLHALSEAVGSKTALVVGLIR